MGLTLVKQDLFTEASTLALESHTANLGGGWTAGTGAIQVNDITDKAESNNIGNGNRYTMTSAAGVAELDVYGTVSSVGVATEARAALVAGRRTGTTLATDSDRGYEGGYDRSLQAWTCDDNQGGFVSFSEGYPGDDTQILLEIRTARKAIKLAGVEKAALTTDINPTSSFVGISLIDFDGTVNNLVICDNFEAWTFVADGAIIEEYHYARRIEQQAELNVTVFS